MNTETNEIKNIKMLLDNLIPLYNELTRRFIEEYEGCGGTFRKELPFYKLSLEDIEDTEDSNLIAIKEVDILLDTYKKDI